MLIKRQVVLTELIDRPDLGNDAGAIRRAILLMEIMPARKHIDAMLQKSKKIDIQVSISGVGDWEDH